MSEHTVAFELSYTFVSLACWVEGCGVVFALEHTYKRKLVEGGITFYCPNGHRIRYGESEIERLKKFLESERYAHERTRDRLKREEHAHRGTRGVVTRIKNRIAHGVCPCCKRTFADVARHMKTKHPDFAEPPEVRA
jgi:hypothetical protein